MANPFLGQILGSVLGRGGGAPGGGSGSLGGLGGILAGGTRGGPGRDRPGLGGGGHTALLAMLLPLALQWVQRNGGIGQVLQRVGQRGYGSQAASWVGTGPNETIGPDMVDQVMGPEELQRLSQQLGVPQHEVAEGFAEILPEVVDQLSPDGRIPPDADDRLDAGQSRLNELLAETEAR